jgi:hypothetical protein
MKPNLKLRSHKIKIKNFPSNKRNSNHQNSQKVSTKKLSQTSFPLEFFTTQNNKFTFLLWSTTGLLKIGPLLVYLFYFSFSSKTEENVLMLHSYTFFFKLKEAAPFIFLQRIFVSTSQSQISFFLRLQIFFEITLQRKRKRNLQKGRKFKTKRSVKKRNKFTTSKQNKTSKRNSFSEELGIKIQRTNKNDLKQRKGEFPQL